MPPSVICVVPHTHWDREWYHPAARFRLRLARLVDDLAARLPGERLPFLLDAQGVVLDDYAALRPAGAATLRRLLAAGLEAGPWYVLPDELLVGAEALVRNLLAGTAAVRRFGGRPLDVGYAPDAFGHSAALPQILAGFGIDSAVVWRGFGGAGGGDLHWWSGPDGSRVLMVHLPRPGYEYGANLPAARGPARARWRSLRALLAPRARSPWWLVLNGADHHALQHDLPAAVAALRAASGATVRLTGLGAYARAVSAWARRHGGGLPRVQGELREGWAHAWALQGTHGSRVYLKQWNAWCQRLLGGVAEPLAALAGTGDLATGVRATWRTLLLNHPHDSICGTSHDDVHRDMMARFREVASAGTEIITQALDVVLGREPDAAREAPPPARRPALVAFNPSARARHGLIEAWVAAFVADEPVGSLSHRRRGRRARPGALVIRGRGGRPLVVQELERRPGHDLVESPRHYPDAAAVEWRRVLVHGADLPPLGVSVLPVATARRAPRAAPVPRAVRARAHGLDNGRLWLRVESDGTVAVADRVAGRSAHGLGGLEDEPDAGDSYTSSVPSGARTPRAPDVVAVRLVHGGPLRGEIEVRRDYRAAGLETVMRVTLDAGADVVGFAVRGVNRRPDHRLRLVMPVGERAVRVVADAHFGAVERGVGAARAPRGALEQPAATAPLQRWVAVAGRRRALAVIADGLSQYEVRSDGEVLVTGLRAFGQLSKRDLPERPGHAGWPTPTPEAQCLGPFAARVAVRLIGPRDLDDPAALDAAADDFLVPPWAVMQRAFVTRPRAVRGPRLEGTGLVFSAMKPAERGSGIILRCVNVTGAVVRGAWHLPWRVRRVVRCRLDETPLGRVATARGVVAFDAAPRAVVTLLVT